MDMAHSYVRVDVHLAHSYVRVDDVLSMARLTFSVCVCVCEVLGNTVVLLLTAQCLTRCR